MKYQTIPNKEYFIKIKETVVFKHINVIKDKESCRNLPVQRRVKAKPKGKSQDPVLGGNAIKAFLGQLIKLAYG